MSHVPEIDDPRRVDIIHRDMSSGQPVDRVIESDVPFDYARKVSVGTGTGGGFRMFRFLNECAKPDSFDCADEASYVERSTTGDAARTVCCNHSGVSRGWELV